MGVNLLRRQLDSKRGERLAAQKKASEFRAKETRHRNAAGTARTAADKAKSPSARAAKLREAERAERNAAAAGKDANRWEAKANTCAKALTDLERRITKAEQNENSAAERRRQLQQRQADRERTDDANTMRRRMTKAEALVNTIMRQVPPPKQEKLRVLILGAASQGDLRVGREAKRIRTAVESALHRDSIELDVRPAATTDDLLDGITKFRPHVVHFSGHSGHELIVFEDERDERHRGVIVRASAFASAIKATDSPPLLVLLNSCNSAAQIDSLVDYVAPFAIGMADAIQDGDAITYAAQFYRAVANGQSIASAHELGKAALELGGLSSSELPVLAYSPEVEPATTVLVKIADVMHA